MKLQNVNNNNYPFNYYTFDNFFNSDEINQLKKIELNNNSSVLTGERISNNNRYYLTVENIKNSNVLEEIVKYFLDSNVINFFENKHNLTLKDSYLRVELVGDKKGSFIHFILEYVIQNVLILNMLSKVVYSFFITSYEHFKF